MSDIENIKFILHLKALHKFSLKTRYFFEIEIYTVWHVQKGNFFDEPFKQFTLRIYNRLIIVEAQAILIRVPMIL